MSGYAVFYPFGFDDNGLPTDALLKKKRDYQHLALGRQNLLNYALKKQ